MTLRLRASYLPPGGVGYAAIDPGKSERDRPQARAIFGSLRTSFVGSSIADRIDSFILALDEDRVAKLPPDRALVRILTEYGRMALAEDTTAIQKLVLAESDRFPALAADFYRGAVIATQRVFVRCLERLCREGAIEIEDLNETAGMLRGMMIFEPSRGAMFCQKALPGIDEIENRATRCARLFLDGCRKDQERSASSSQQCAGVVETSQNEPR